jgi:hypothetical protein
VRCGAESCETEVLARVDKQWLLQSAASWCVFLQSSQKGLEIRCSIRLSYAPALVFSSVYQLWLLRKLYRTCTCLKSLSQLAHRILNFYVANLDVALPGRANIAVTQYPLDHEIIDAQFL